MRFYLVAAVPAALFICISSNKEICDGSVASSLLSLTSQLKKRRSLSPPHVICHRSIDRPCLQGIWVTLRVSLSDLLTMLCFFFSFFFCLRPSWSQYLFARTFKHAKLSLNPSCRYIFYKSVLEVYKVCCTCKCWCENER